ncbi:nitroreductase family deazaflavin-dependent oxidoreductase [Streptomyces rimosus]|uniref:nitroreductase family deazaflavin-dependent oxidoreductase n=1 Tax=Streptomyces rimosus TaxID=1927 RepID=UPI0004C8E04C|nr:nitroreductase family deazaflavin-dependent oxidoreductase [Streptomyces rimosus]
MKGTGRRLVQKVSATRAFARVAPYVIPALDRTVHRLTGGKVLLSARMLPGAILTATGARTGLPRRTPLACLPEESGTWLLIGSNFGRTGHPSWTANLLKNPAAEISWRGRDIPVRARLLSGDERARAWAEVREIWPPYAAYQARVTREIRIFRLEARS